MKIISEGKTNSIEYDGKNFNSIKKISIIDFLNNYIKDRDDFEDWASSRLKNYIRSKEWE